MNPKESPDKVSSRPDMYQYKLSITEKGTENSFFFDDMSAPEEVRPLLHYLQQCAVAERMKGL